MTEHLSESFVEAPKPALHIFLLGGFRVRFGDTVVTGLETSSHQVLLAYLALQANQVHLRQQLAFLLWPDSTESQARTNLRKAIYQLRHVLPEAEHFLRLEKQTVQWRPDAAYTLDVVAFETAVSQAQQSDAPATQKNYLRQALEIYQGDFLPGHYHDWVIIIREELRQVYLACLEQLIQQLEREREYPAAITYAQRLLRADPLHEATYRRLMRLQALTSNSAAALRTYHTCATTLQQELGVSPSAATRESYERLLKVGTPPVSHFPARVPLVGRQQAWSTLQTAWRQATSEKPRMVLLSGEAGIGKTRLAEELLDWAGRQGIVTATTTCYPAEGRLPYAPVAEWLRSEALQKSLTQLADKWLVEVARLLPEVLARRSDLSPPGPLTEGWQRHHLFAALSHTVLSASQPLLLLIDDLQWGDLDTLEWLHFLLRFDDRARFLLVGAARSEELTADHPLIPLQHQLHHEDYLIEIELERLGADATHTLATHVTGQLLEPAQAAQFYEATEGNPLFIVESMRAGLYAAPPTGPMPGLASPEALPPKVRRVIETRLRQLSPSAYDLTGLAATIGRSFTFDLLAQASEEEVETLVCSLDELWHRRIVREQGTDTYSFSHDKIRQVAYTALGAARRRLWHSRVATALETIYADNLDRVSGELAIHYEATQQHQTALRFYQRAAQVSRRIYANQETLQHLRRAIILLSVVEVDQLQHVALYEQLGEVLFLMGQPEAAQEAFETALACAPEPLCQSRLYRKIADTQQVRRQFEPAFATWQAAEAVLGELPEKEPSAWWQEWLWVQLERIWALYLTNQIEQMVELTSDIRSIVERHGVALQRGLYFQRLVLLSYRRDRYVVPDETVSHALASWTAIQEPGTPSQVAFARFVLGFTHLWHGWPGDLAEAEEHFQAALQQAEQIGDVVVQTRCLNFLTHLHRRQASIDHVRRYIARTQAVAKKADMPEYFAEAEAQAAWVAWRKGDLAGVETHGLRALSLHQKTAIVWPAKWVAAWPLLGAALRRNEVRQAIPYAQMMLEPDQHRLTEELTARLEQAIAAWTENQADIARTHLQQSLQLAQELGYL